MKLTMMHRRTIGLLSIIAGRIRTFRDRNNFIDEIFFTRKQDGACKFGLTLVHLQMTQAPRYATTGLVSFSCFVSRLQMNSEIANN